MSGRNGRRRAAQGGGATWWGEVEYSQAHLRESYTGSYDAPAPWADRGAPGAAAGIDRS